MKKIIGPLVLILSMLAGNLCAQTVKVVPQLGYEYTTGSQDYYGHSVSGGIVFKFKKAVRFSTFYNYLNDKDYAAIHSGLLRLKGPVSANWDGTIGATVSGGSLKNSDDQTSSAGFNLGAIRYIGRAWEWTSGYRYTSGSLSTFVNRQVITTKGSRESTVTIREEDVSKYIAHGFSTKVGYENQTYLKGQFTSLRLGLTFNSDDATIISETIDTYFPLPYDSSLGLSFSMNQNSKFADLNYLGISVDKSF